MVILKRFSAVFSVITAIMILSFTSAAESREFLRWNGTEGLQNGNTYIVDRNIKVKSDFHIPEGAELIVTKYGKISFAKNIKVIVGGGLTVENGGVFEHSFGAMTFSDTSKIRIDGQFSQWAGTNLEIHTKDFTAGRNADIISSGSIKTYKGSKIENFGTVKLNAAGNVTLAGEFHNSDGSECRILGSFVITESGKLQNDGHVLIGNNGRMRNGGYFAVSRNAGYTRVGEQTDVANGVFLDLRTTFKYERMTVSILADEPEEMYNGIDVSSFQGEIDWAKVKAAGVDFAIIRLGYGSKNGKNPISIDKNFIANMEGAAQNNIDTGIYFYSYARSIAEARAEAIFLVKSIAPFELTYPVVLDMEDETQKRFDKTTLTAMVEAFFEVLMENGYYPMLYSYKTWLEDNLDMKRLDRYAVWVAHIDVPETTYQGGYYIWQHSHTGTVDGIEGAVDLNLSYRNFPSILRKNKLNRLK